MKNTINLELPIKIKPTVNNDGYVITDANETEHFFYEKESESEDMVYDGRCSVVTQKEEEYLNEVKELVRLVNKSTDLQENGWQVECESPLEIRHEDGSFASMNAAYHVAESLNLSNIFNSAFLIKEAYKSGLIDKDEFTIRMIKVLEKEK